MAFKDLPYEAQYALAHERPAHETEGEALQATLVGLCQEQIGAYEQEKTAFLQRSEMNGFLVSIALANNLVRLQVVRDYALKLIEVIDNAQSPEDLLGKLDDMLGTHLNSLARRARNQCWNTGTTLQHSVNELRNSGDGELVILFDNLYAVLRGPAAR